MPQQPRAAHVLYLGDRDRPKVARVPVAEDNEAMVGLYAMIDPLGRFYDGSTGRYVYSDPILEVGVDQALAQVGFAPEKLVARGGVYD